jgi:hypothetical protein
MPPYDWKSTSPNGGVISGDFGLITHSFLLGLPSADLSDNNRNQIGLQTRIKQAIRFSLFHVDLDAKQLCHLFLFLVIATNQCYFPLKSSAIDLSFQV